MAKDLTNDARYRNTVVIVVLIPTLNLVATNEEDVEVFCCPRLFYYGTDLLQQHYKGWEVVTIVSRRRLSSRKRRSLGDIAIIKVLGKKNKKTILLVASSHFVNQNIGIIIAINSISENIENYTAKRRDKSNHSPSPKK